MGQYIYIVDDEEDIVELITLHLKKNNFQVKGFYDAEHLFSALKKEIPDCLILDIMLPDKSGTEICKELRSHDKFSHIPIIILTAKTDETDKILGLELGADDYVTKPFSPRELIARIKAVIRRSTRNIHSQLVKISDSLSINSVKHEVFLNKEKIDLTLKEFKLLEVLSEKPGWAFSREQLLDAVWGNDTFVFERTVDVHIKHLRTKLKSESKLIKNVRGIGYKLDL